MAANLQQRPYVAGKFIYYGKEKFLIRGVTYGTFKPNSAGEDFPEPEIIERDLQLMAEAGVNVVRVYTRPSRYFLDQAHKHGLKVIVGVPWSQHVCFGDQWQLSQEIIDTVRQTVTELDRHPAVLALAIGNEIPAPIVRWHGRKKIAKFLRALYETAKQVDPGLLVTYVNYPPTEYLELGFLDFCCFNLFLHNEGEFRGYVARLQNIAGSRPLVLTEVGMDSIREGLAPQAEFIDWQLRVAYELGVAGACVFSWTDDWYRGGFQVEDWAFGLVDAKRKPKPALASAKAVFAEVPFSARDAAELPKISVVICAYNAQSTMEDCMESLMALKYPDFEIIVIDDGSKDKTAEIARRYPVRLVSIPNGGLSAARNLGYTLATGEIVAYTDSDCRVDPHWLAYLVVPFMNSDVVAVGGPNLVPLDDPWMAHCVARSPGGPTQVLLTDTIAEHIPGCNMAYYKWALEEIHGFDPIFIKAGDDVDVCWRLQERGHRIGFSHSALVWHHHRNRVKAYWRQQVGYGEGETMLERKHPDKFNELGHMQWQGRLYSPLPAYQSLTTQRIYHGRWGSSPFPSVYQRHSSYLTNLPQSVEWQALMLVFAVSALLDPWFLAVSAIGFGLTFSRCLSFAAATNLRYCPPIDSAPRWLSPILQRLVIAYLHFIQPLARMRGRVKQKLSGEQRVQPGASINLGIGDILYSTFVKLPRGLLNKSVLTYWSVNCVETDTFLTQLTNRLSKYSDAISTIRLDDGWQERSDLVVRSGPLLSAQVKSVAEDHGSRKRLIRLAAKIRVEPLPWLTVMLFLTILVYLIPSPWVHGHWRGIAMTDFSVLNLVLVWRAARLLTQVQKGSNEVADALGLFAFTEHTDSDRAITAKDTGLEHETVR